MIYCNLFCVGFYERKPFGELRSNNILNYLHIFNLNGRSEAVIQPARNRTEPTDRLKLQS